MSRCCRRFRPQRHVLAIAFAGILAADHTPYVQKAYITV
jgi:hypothetical protein